MPELTCWLLYRLKPVIQENGVDYFESKLKYTGVEMWKHTAIPALAVLALTLVTLRPWISLRAQSGEPPSPFDSSSHTLLIRYGVKDDVEKTWRGRLEP